MRIYDVEAWKQTITLSQLKRWMAFYREEPWGQPWRMMGRAVSLIRSALGVKYDKHDEERFLISYRTGDEYRPAVPQTKEEIAAALAAIPGMKRKKKT